MPARLNGRTNRRNSSSSGMKENAVDLGAHFFLRPIGMLAANARRFDSAGRPIAPFCQLQSPLARHGAQNGELFGTGLFIRKHDGTVRRRIGDRKLFALAKLRRFPGSAAPAEWNGTVADRLTLKFCASLAF